MATSDKSAAAAGTSSTTTASTGTASTTTPPPTSDAIVAAGHTVLGDDGVTYGPGETVPLTEHEIKRLRAAGFLKDEESTDDAGTAAGDGPTLKQDGPGPSVKGK